MAKKVLLLYFSPEEKKAVENCIPVFKAIMRKFRQSISFTFMQLYTDSECRARMKELYLKAVFEHDSVILCSSFRNTAEENIFYSDIAEICVTEHHTAGRVICTPAGKFTVESIEKAIVEKSVYFPDNIKKASVVSAQLAKERKHNLMICTSPDGVEDGILFTECEFSISKDMHIHKEHTDIETLISVIFDTLPSADVILTTEMWAKIILLHIKKQSEFHAGYCVKHTENGKIYCHRISDSQSSANTDVSSILMAFSAILENEFSMASAAVFLRRCTASAFESNDFLSDIIEEIKKPLRQRKTLL